MIDVISKEKFGKFTAQTRLDVVIRRFSKKSRTYKKLFLRHTAENLSGGSGICDVFGLATDHINLYGYKYL